MNVSQVLVAADARLTPETWTQQPSVEHRLGHHDKECPFLAIDRATSNRQMRRAATALFAEVVSGAPTSSACRIFLWNDEPGRTLADVHSAFSAAVAIAESQEQPVREEVPA